MIFQSRYQYWTTVGVGARRHFCTANAISSVDCPRVRTVSLPWPGATSGNLPAVSKGNGNVIVDWNARSTSRFHNIWLRDHCRCPKCFHAVTKQRLFNTAEIPLNIAPASITSKQEGLQVAWSQFHESLYPWSWLHHYSYYPVLNCRSASDRRTLWGKNVGESPPSLAHEEVMAENELGLYKLLQNIDKFGFSFVNGVPATPHATEELIKRIGFIRQTQYGHLWDFTSDLAKGDMAYTNLALGAHTDTTYFTDPCGLQVFHLLSHTGGSGGTSLLVDGFYVAALLKSLSPKAYSLLSKVHIQAHAAGESSALYNSYPNSGYPVLRHDTCSGELFQVRWNNDDRSVLKGLDPELVEEWYEAIRQWHSCLTSPKSEYWVQLRPGLAVVIDNHRVLHGRSAFDGKRRMCGAYVGMDEWRSKFATLGEKFKPDIVLESTKNLQNTIVEGRSIWNLAI